jgi:hypothetical protein
MKQQRNDNFFIKEFSQQAFNEATQYFFDGHQSSLIGVAWIL